MVASKQMALSSKRSRKAGAKLVLVGDPEQLQPIEAGAAFRAIVERIGYAELETIYRQKEAMDARRLARPGARPDRRGDRRLQRPGQGDRRT
jgi:ATP-dependent exoDNAse (exonuclease V) alpha subunit